MTSPMLTVVVLAVLWLVVVVPMVLGRRDDKSSSSGISRKAGSGWQVRFERLPPAVLPTPE